jgi:hypothetical protein
MAASVKLGWPELVWLVMRLADYHFARPPASWSSVWRFSIRRIIQWSKPTTFNGIGLTRRLLFGTAKPTLCGLSVQFDYSDFEGTLIVMHDQFLGEELSVPMKTAWRTPVLRLCHAVSKPLCLTALARRRGRKRLSPPRINLERLANGHEPCARRYLYPSGD